MQRAPFAKVKGVFCVKVLTNCAKRFIIMLEVNRAYGTRSAKADTEKRGVNPRRRNGTVNARSAKSGHRFRRFGGFPAGRYAVHKDVCTKAFGFGAFSYGGKIASKYQNAEQRCSILYSVKNDMLCSRNGNSSPWADCDI